MVAHWLMKAEPDSRIVKGKDVAFSVEDFEKLGTSPWDGVRNHQAKNFMQKRMKLKDQVLFYHSNCKEPGVTAIAEVVKEGYPDFTALDSSHPYYDPKSDKDKPTWFMVDVQFKQRLNHLVSLKLLQNIAQLSKLPEELTYLSSDHLAAIKGMALLNRGRLSVQDVSPLAFEAVCLLGEHGGWDEALGKKIGKNAKRKAAARPKEETESAEEADDESVEKNEKTSTKNEVKEEAETEDKPAKRSRRRK